MNDQQSIQAFLAGERFAVAGASRDRSKYGNKVLRVYLQNERDVIAVNPKETMIEDVSCYPSLAEIPGEIHGVSIITPPSIAAQIVDDAIELGIRHLWMQPGAEHDEAIERARAAGVNVIAHGPCALVIMGYSEK